MKRDTTNLLTKQYWDKSHETSPNDAGIVESDLAEIDPNSEKVRSRLPHYTLETAFASVPALPDRDAGDFDDLIDEAMEEHAAWVVDRMRRGLE